MYRAIPGVGNKNLTKKWVEVNQQINQNKLKKVKSRVDISEPMAYNMTKKGSKRDLLIESKKK